MDDPTDTPVADTPAADTGVTGTPAADAPVAGTPAADVGVTDASVTGTPAAAPGRLRRLARLTRERPVFVVLLGVLALHFLTAITGPWWAPYTHDTMLVGEPFTGPSWDHLFGTDNFGRDVFSRVVRGERIVLIQGLSASGLAIISGSTIGILLAYKRGWVDEVGMRGVDIMLALPGLILTLLILGSIETNNLVIIITVAFFFTWPVTLTVRAAALGVVTEDFVTKAKLRGESAFSIARREILPNVLGNVLVEFSLRTGYAVFFIGALSFLGFAAAPPSPEWGLMINEGRKFLSASKWMVLGPAGALASLVVALSLVTEEVADILGVSTRRSSD